MHVFIIGITGGVGSLLAETLRRRGDTVSGLVRKAEQGQLLMQQGITAVLGDLTTLTAAQLAEHIGTADAIAFSAGAGGNQDATTAIDGEGVAKTIAAADLLPHRPRLVLVSVFPEAWRERDVDADFEHYISVKKRADVAVADSDLDYVILRPAALRDAPGVGRVSLGPAQIHHTITRADVAETLAILLHEPIISRRILEVTEGDTPIAAAVEANARN